MSELTSAMDTVRISAHVLAASVWVGGQFVVGAAVGALRRDHQDALKPLARSFGRIAWTAYAVVVLTGMWSLAVMDVTATSLGYQFATLAKVSVAIGSGGAAAVHTMAQSRTMKALGGAAALILSVGALVLGVLIRSGA
jgi:putative copper export protein